MQGLPRNSRRFRKIKRRNLVAASAVPQVGAETALRFVHSAQSHFIDFIIIIPKFLGKVCIQLVLPVRLVGESGNDDLNEEI